MLLTLRSMAHHRGIGAYRGQVQRSKFCGKSCQLQDLIVQHASSMPEEEGAGTFRRSSEPGACQGWIRSNACGAATRTAHPPVGCVPGRGRPMCSPRSSCPRWNSRNDSMLDSTRRRNRTRCRAALSMKLMVL